MKKFYYLLSSIAVILLITVACEKSSFDDNSIESAQSKESLQNKESLQGKSDGCTTIQSGLITGSDGNVIEMGYDKWGYNYNAHMFNGFYCDSYRDADWCQEYKDIELIMKWNDAWISNQDCDGDGLLDRHTGFTSYRGSGAWLTNHQKGTYSDEVGNECKWEYFSKIVAVPTDAVLIDGIWFNADGGEIGPVIWDEFATIEEVSNDPCDGLKNGKQYGSPVGPGFGKY